MESVRTGLLNRLWWIPLAFVVVALLALLSTPVLVSRRVNALRDSFEIPNKRRVVINDLEAAIATELLLKGRLDAPRAAADERDSAYETARAQAQADESELDSIAQRVGPEAVRRFASFRALGREARERGSLAPSARAGDGMAGGTDGGPTLLAAAESLD